MHGDFGGVCLAVTACKTLSRGFAPGGEEVDLAGALGVNADRPGEGRVRGAERARGREALDDGGGERLEDRVHERKLAEGLQRVRIEGLVSDPGPDGHEVQVLRPQDRAQADLGHTRLGKEDGERARPGIPLRRAAALDRGQPIGARLHPVGGGLEARDRLAARRRAGQPAKRARHRERVGDVREGRRRGGASVGERAGVPGREARPRGAAAVEAGRDVELAQLLGHRHRRLGRGDEALRHLGRHRAVERRVGVGAPDHDAGGGLAGQVLRLLAGQPNDGRGLDRLEAPVAERRRRARRVRGRSPAGDHLGPAADAACACGARSPLRPRGVPIPERDRSQSDTVLRGAPGKSLSRRCLAAAATWHASGFGASRVAPRVGRRGEVSE